MRKILLALLAVLAFQPAYAQVFLSENFNSGAGTFTITDGGSTMDTWFATTGGYGGGGTNYLDGTEFLLVDSDAAGSASTTCLIETATSPVMNTAGATFLQLEFDQYFRWVSSTDTGYVEVFDGSSWVNVYTVYANTGAWNNPDHQIINITAYANANMQVRFVYVDGCSWAWYWGIDNVTVSQPLLDDPGVTAVTAPATGGRMLTSSALSATEGISIDVENFGSNSLSNIPVYYSVNGGAPVGPELIAGPLAAGATTSYTFSATADLSLVGTYTIEAWTALSGDSNTANDTASTTVSQLPNAPVQLPMCQDFEGANDTLIHGNMVGVVANVPELDFITADPVGRLRTAAGAGFYNSGSRAVTLDIDPSGSVIVNYAILTYNMSNFDASSDVILFDFSFMEHGDEVHANDSVWVRGCDTCNWIGVIGWNTTSGGTNGVYFDVIGTDLSALLNNAGQNFSTSTQIRFGQEDNFPATSTTSSDGFSFDDVCMSQLLNINTGVTAITGPADGSCADSMSYISVIVENFGVDTLSNIPVYVDVTGSGTASLMDTLPGPIAFGESDTLLLGPWNNFNGGTFTICSYTGYAGDSVFLDDTTCVTIDIEPIPIPVGIGDTICAGDSAMIYVMNPDSNITYTWWDSLAGGSMLATSDMYQTPGLSGTTTYYVEGSGNASYQVGAADNSISGGGDYTFYSDGLRFDVSTAIVIDSVFVYPGIAGNVTVVIDDNLGGTIGSVTVAVSGPGRTVVPLGISVPPGTDYEMHATGTTTGLYRNTGGAVYPYSIPGVMDITEAINQLAGYYYFFYDWHVTAQGCSGPRVPVTVDVLSSAPTAGFNTSTSSLTAAFTDGSSLGIDTYAWDFGDGSTDSVASPTHTYAAAGTYVVCLAVTDICGGTNTFCDTITVCTPLTAAFTSTNSGLQADFTDASATATAWAWDFGDGNTSAQQDPSHTYSADGIYVVCLTATDACAVSDTVCDSVAVCAAMTAAYSYTVGGNGLDYTFTDATGGSPVSWAWDFGDGNTSTQQNPSHTYAADGSFTVSLTVTNLCGESVTTDTTIIVVGVDEALGGSLSVYPNPNQGIFTVSLGDLFVEQINIRVYDLLGHTVYQREFAPMGSAFNTQIDLGDQAKGTYFIELSLNGSRAVKRIVVE